VIKLKITEEVEKFDVSVDGIEFESDAFDGDETVSITIGNQMVNVKREQLKRVVSAL
jgi:hypothetical protein